MLLLSITFEISRITGQLPDRWKKSNVTPNFKNRGTRKLLEDVRFAALMGTACVALHSFLPSSGCPVSMSYQVVGQCVSLADVS